MPIRVAITSAPFFELQCPIPTVLAWLERPAPPEYLGFVDAMLVGIQHTSDLHILELLFGVRAGRLELRHAVDHIDGQSEAVDFVIDCQLHRGIDVAVFLIAAYVQVVVVGAVVWQPVNEPGIAVEVENKWFVHGKEAVEVAVAQAVGMLAIGLHLEQIDDIYKADFQIREFLAQHRRCGQRFLSWYVAGTSHHNIGFLTLVVAGLAPDANALGAVRDGGVHIEILQVELLVANDDVDIAFAAQAMVGHRQQAVDIRRQVYSSYFSSFVDDYVDESGILVCKAVMILAPDG